MTIKYMFPEQLKKILKLIKKTGDRFIILDSQIPDESYVIMDLDNYAALVEPEKLLAPHPVCLTDDRQVNENKQDYPAKEASKVNLTEEDLTDKINREISMWKNREDAPYLEEENKPKKAWAIPSSVKNKAQEIK